MGKSTVRRHKSQEQQICEEKVTTQNTEDVNDEDDFDSNTVIISNSGSDDISEEEKKEIVQRDSSSFIELANEFKQKLDELSEQVKPLISKVKKNRLETKEGISYLEVKFHLLLNYCMNVLFFILMKSCGKSVEDHPVIDKLIEIRLLLEQIKPIDEKMKFQLNKLLTIASSLSDKQQTSTSYSSELNNDQAKYGPNPDNLDNGDYKRNKSFDVEDTENDANNTEMSHSDNEENDFYVVPKVVPVTFDEKSAKKSKQEQERIYKRLKKSGMIKTLNDIIGETPEERPQIGRESKQSRNSEFERDLEKYELDNFKRKQLSKREKKKLKQSRNPALHDELQELEQFDELLGIDDYIKNKKGAQEQQKVTLMEYIGEEKDALRIAKKKYKIAGSDDDDDENNEIDLADDFGDSFKRSKGENKNKNRKKQGHKRSRGDDNHHRSSANEQRDRKKRQRTEQNNKKKPNNNNNNYKQKKNKR